MASNLLDLTADIVKTHASSVEMSSDDLLKELKTVYATLQGWEKGEMEISAQKPTKRGRKAKDPAEPISDEKHATRTNPVTKLLEYLKKQDTEVQDDIAYLMSTMHPSFDHPIVASDFLLTKQFDSLTKQFYSQIEKYSGNQLSNIGFLVAFRAIFDFTIVSGRGTIENWVRASNFCEFELRSHDAQIKKAAKKRLYQLPARRDQWMATCQQWQELKNSALSDETIKAWRRRMYLYVV